jgi:uncharacterized protein
MVDKFIGFPYPILDNPKGYFYKQHDLNQIKADMLILLLTYPNERIMLPTFGTPLDDLLFDPNDATLAAKARAMIINSITNWEPRIAVNQITVLTSADVADLNSQDNLTELGAILEIRISFVDPQNIQNVQDLVLEVPLQTAS